MSLRVISYGGGVQSTALLVLAVQGKLGKVDAALFSNVGDDSEHPATLLYVREVAQPYAGTAVPVYELKRQRRDGSTRTLAQHIEQSRRSIPIPIRMATADGAPGNRSCTADYKIAVIDKWLRQHGATAKHPAEVLIGFSWDEVERLGNKRSSKRSVPSHPLIDLRLTVHDCRRIIKDAGLLVPGKSSCFFCPFTKPSRFARMRRDEPALFHRAVEIERMINQRRAQIGRDPAYLTRFCVPLDEAVKAEQPGLDFGTGPGETCDEGHCWT